MIDILLKYMKPLYIAILNLYKEINNEIGMDESSLPIHTTKGEVRFPCLSLLSFCLLFYTYK